MDPLVEAVRLLGDFLYQHNIRFMLIGGLANAIWGRARATTDADLVLVLGERSIAEMVQLIGSRFRLLKADPVEFAKRTYVVPVQVTDFVTADLSLAILPYEQQAIERAAPVDIGGMTLPVCQAEDLIIYKAISEREKDWLDIQGVLNRHGKGLDQEYILNWLRQFAAALERPELLPRYKNLVDKLSETGKTGDVPGSSVR